MPDTVTWKIDRSLSLVTNLKKFIVENPEFKNYTNTHVIIENSYYVTVPAELFDKEQIDFLYHQNFSKRSNEYLCYDIIPNNNIVVIYNIDNVFYQLLQSLFPTAHYHTHITQFIKHFSIESHNGNNKKMYVNVRNDAVDLLCFDNGRLLLSNSFFCREKTDRLYYILNAWKMLNFDQESDDIFIYGYINNNELYTLLSKYIRHSWLLKSDEEFKILKECE